MYKESIVTQEDSVNFCLNKDYDLNEGFNLIGVWSNLILEDYKIGSERWIVNYSNGSYLRLGGYGDIISMSVGSIYFLFSYSHANFYVEIKWDKRDFDGGLIFAIKYFKLINVVYRDISIEGKNKISNPDVLNNFSLALGLYIKHYFFNKKYERLWIDWSDVEFFGV